MNSKQRLEFILAAIFLMSCICTFLNLPFSRLAAVLSGFLLGGLYFYGAFWLYGDYAIPLITRIITGLLFSLAVLACMFWLLKWPLFGLYSVISCIGFGLIIIVSIFNSKNTGYKQLLYRCIFFIIVLIALNAVNFLVRHVPFRLI